MRKIIKVVTVGALMAVLAISAPTYAASNPQQRSGDIYTTDHGTQVIVTFSTGIVWPRPER